MTIWTKPGCYADGVYGHDHIRDVLSDMLATVSAVARPTHDEHEVIKALMAELEGEPSDDYSEEDDAIEFLNGYVKGGLWLDMVNGDLVILEESK